MDAEALAFVYLLDRTNSLYGAVFHEKLLSAQLVRNSRLFTEPEGFLPCTLESKPSPYPEPDASRRLLNFNKIRRFTVRHGGKQRRFSAGEAGPRVKILK
jgi:hypothetical protein